MQKAKPCHLFSPAYMEFEFPEEETARAFPASLFLQTTDDSYDGADVAFSAVSDFLPPGSASPWVAHGSLLCLLSPSSMGSRRCFAPVLVPRGEFFLAVLATGKLVAFSGSFFI